MSVKTILTEPNKLLRKISDPVEKVGDEEKGFGHTQCWRAVMGRWC